MQLQFHERTLRSGPWASQCTRDNQLGLRTNDARDVWSSRELRAYLISVLVDLLASQHSEAGRDDCGSSGAKADVDVTRALCSGARRLYSMVPMGFGENALYGSEQRS